MKHKPFIRHVPESDHAVLLIHGIAGTPAHFRDLLPLIPENWSICNLLLDGHGGSVKDFSASSMAKWKSQVSGCLHQLRAEHKHILIIAHSMGTLLSIQEAIRDSRHITGLFLLNVPLRVHLPLSTILTSLKAALGKYTQTDAAVQAMVSDCSIRLTPRLWEYAGWIPRFWELLAEVRRTRGMISSLNIPCFAFQSQQDELVSGKSCDFLNRIPCVTLTVLDNSGHFLYSPEDTCVLQTVLKKLL